MKATYNITNNRLFLWPEMPKGSKLPTEQYERLKACHLATWWPRGCFTGLWSPRGEDLLIELCGEIEADDTPDDLDRRVGRYEKYAERSGENSEHAKDRILSGKAHTNRQVGQAERAMKSEAEKAEYWHSRIAGSIAAAEYKDKPAVITRRIMGLEKDMRGEVETLEVATRLRGIWLDADPITYERAKEISNTAKYSVTRKFSNADFPTKEPHYEGQMSIYSALTDGIITAQTAKDIELRALGKLIRTTERWIEHIKMRLEYENAYLVSVAGVDPRKALEGVGIGDTVMYRNEEREVISVGSRNLLLKSNTPTWKWATKAKREDITGIVRKAATPQKATRRVSKAPDDGIKKTVLWNSLRIL
jgi:hypothetical protein